MPQDERDAVEVATQEERRRPEENSRLVSQNVIRFGYQVHWEFQEHREDRSDLTLSKDNLKLEDEEVRK